MALFKCKMCGGDLEISEGVSIAECEYCGTKQTVPKVIDEGLQNLFNRANTLRIKSEFDKAEKLYEKIIQVDSMQPEAYWGLILCKYGIEYVDDPSTFKKIPTCHRASYDSIIADDDYKLALEYADISQRAIYEHQAKEIDRIQKEILSLAQKEETYDVFICYKETDAEGKRTQDSVIANDIYYQLKQEGFKVFYAAITLEGKLGSAYEPIIFAALNSAKVMLAIGTRPEYFNAVWVKNEWSRFLKIIKKDRSKLLIPCYRDMDAYELPEEFAHLQAQDMSKIGFISDLVRGIKKVVKKEDTKTTIVKETVITNNNTKIIPLLKRTFMFLEDGDWESADEYAEKVLDSDPENAQAYLAKLMAELYVHNKEDLKNCSLPFDSNNYYKKALRFGDEKLKNELRGYVEHINIRNKNEELEAQYNEYVRLMNRESNNDHQYREVSKLLASMGDYRDAQELSKVCTEKALLYQYESNLKAMNDASTVKDFIYASNRFSAMGEYKNARELSKACLEKAEEVRIADIEFAEKVKKNNIYSEAMKLMALNNIASYEKALDLFKQIQGWKDSTELAHACEMCIEQIKAEEEQRRFEAARQAEIAAKLAYEREIKRQKRNKIIAIVTPIIFGIVIMGILLVNLIIIPNARYNRALKLLDEGNYDDATSIFNELGSFLDSKEQAKYAQYKKALHLLAAGKYTPAYDILKQLGNYADASYQLKQSKYDRGVAYINSGLYDNGYNLLNSISDYLDAKEIVNSSKYERGVTYINNGQYNKGYELLDSIPNYLDAKEISQSSKYQRGVAYINAGEYDTGYALLNQILNYLDAREIVQSSIYNRAMDYYNKKNYPEAYNLFLQITKYKDSAQKAKTCKEKIPQQYIDNKDYSSYIRYTLINGKNTVSIPASENLNFYNAIVSYFSLDKKTYFISSVATDLRSAIPYFELISNYTQAKHVISLYNIMNKYSSYSGGHALFEDNMEQICATFPTKLCRDILLSDDVILYYLLGKWSNADGKYLEFYEKNDATSCSYNVPYPSVSAKYYDVRDLELVFLDSNSKKVADVYKFTFTNANTMKVYSYKDGQTYTLTRTLN